METISYCLFCFFSIYPTLVDVFEEFIGHEIMGVSTIGAWGSQQGFTLLNFIFVYFVGAALRCFEGQLDTIDLRKLLILFFGIVVVIFFWGSMENNLVLHGLRSAWCYHNPLVVVESCILFLIMKRFTIKKQRNAKAINYVGKSTYTGYLIHSYILSLANIHACVNSSIWVMLLSIIGLELIVLTITMLAYFIWQKIFDPVFNISIRRIRTLDYRF